MNPMINIRDNNKTTKHYSKTLFLSPLLIFSLVFMSFASASAPNKPCSAAEYRAFDFWIGEWEVKDANNKVVGHNKIFPILNGCALSENWTSVKGNTGVSYNFYDRAEQKWHQTWVDQSGGALYLNGNLNDSQMTLAGTRPNAQGNPTLHKISWTPLDDGRVKQQWKSSSDKGKTWNDIFVGFYSKKK